MASITGIGECRAPAGSRSHEVSPWRRLSAGERARRERMPGGSGAADAMAYHESQMAASAQEVLSNDSGRLAG